MGKRVKIFVTYFACFIVALFSFSNVYKAINANSNSGSGSFSGNGSSGGPASGCPINTLCDTWKYPGIYVRLVYYDPKGTVAQGFDKDTHQKIIAGPTKVYPYGKNYGSVPAGAISPINGTTQKWMHTEFVRNGSKWTRYTDFDSKQFEKDTVGGNNLKPEVKRENFKNFLASMTRISNGAQGWSNVKLENLTEPSCEVDKTGNCYGKAGYRLIAELYLPVGSDNNSGRRLAPVKSLKENGVTDASINSFQNYKSWAELNVSSYMSIDWTDINYACYKPGSKKGVCADATKNYSIKCLFNKNCGYGIWIVDISSFLTPNYDYQLDMACNNCKATTDKSMVIQDTNDWRDIFESVNVDKNTCGNNYSNIKNYFKKYSSAGVDVFCRDEYHITYPNAKNNIKIQLGRYFTVNETQDNLNVIDSTIPNLAPIEVERTRECRDTNNGVKLKEFNDQKKNDFENCQPGKITLNYKDNTYKYKGVLSANKVSSSSNINGNSLIQKVKYSYHLKENTFRYVRIKDGYSLEKKPSDLTDGNNDGYKDLLVSNLPVSFSTNSKGNQLNFKYELPDDVKCGTYIKRTYDLPDILKCISKKEHDIYNEKSNPENLKNTACAKLYNTTDLNNKDFAKCVNDRIGKDRTGDCKDLNSLCDFESSSECSEDKNYLCDLEFPTGKPTSCNKETAGKKISNAYDFTNMVWDEEGKACCESGTKYASKSGKCCKPELIHDGVCDSKSGTCTKDNHKSLGRDWNENENVCCPVNYKYDVQTKKCEPPADEKCELLGCGNACCYDENKNPYCGTTLNGQLICPGKPNVHNEVYRTIDTTNPFLNQNGNIRDTGENWCSNRSVNGKIVRSCSGSSDNSTVSSVITSKNISEDNAMYKAHLNSSSIDKIRRYNESHSYDDFNFECNSKGDECKSVFIRKSSYGIELTGRCSSGNFGNC